MIRLLLLILIGFLFVAMPLSQEVQAQNLFLSPNKSKAEDKRDGANRKLPRFVVPQKRTVSKKARLATRSRPKPIQARRNPINMEGFDVFSQLGNLDIAMLAANGGVPESADQLVLMAAAFNLPMVNNALSLKNTLEQGAITQVTQLLNRPPIFGN